MIAFGRDINQGPMYLWYTLIMLENQGSPGNGTLLLAISLKNITLRKMSSNEQPLQMLNRHISSTTTTILAYDIITGNGLIV